MEPSEYDVYVLTVQTINTPGLTNLVKSLGAQGYTQFAVLEFGKEYGGTRWEARKFIDGIRTIESRDGQPRRRLYVLVDSGKSFFIRGPSHLFEEYLKYRSKVVVAGQRNWTSGSEDMAKVYQSRTNSVYAFPNTGVIMGSADSLIRTLENIKYHNDTEQGIMEIGTQSSTNFSIDTQCSLVATIPTFNGVMDTSDSKLWYYRNGLLTSQITDNSPAIALFPGDVPYGYNSYVRLHYPGAKLRSYNEVLKSRTFMYVAIGAFVLLVLLVWYGYIDPRGWVGKLTAYFPARPAPSLAPTVQAMAAPATPVPAVVATPRPIETRFVQATGERFRPLATPASAPAEMAM